MVGGDSVVKQTTRMGPASQRAGGEDAGCKRIARPAVRCTSCERCNPSCVVHPGLTQPPLKNTNNVLANQVQTVFIGQPHDMLENRREHDNTKGEPHMRTILVATALTVISLASATASSAQEAAEPYVSKAEYEKLKREVEALREQMKALSQRASQSSSRATTQSSEAGKEPAKPPVQKAETPAELPRASVLPAADREVEAKEARRQLDLFMREQKLLFRRGELQVELDTSYSQDTSERFLFPPAGNDLNFALNKTRFRSVNSTFLGRYGLADDLEFDFDIPFLYAEQEARFFGGGGVRDDDAGLGDVGAGLRYALFREQGGVRPDVILSLETRAPTGNVDVALPVVLNGNGGTQIRSDVGLQIDSWSVGGALTLVKTIDPVIFFAQAGYTKTFADGAIDPGDQIPYAFGLGFSLNDRISVRGAMVGTYIDEIEIAGRSIEDSALEINGLQFTATGQLSRNVFIEPFIGFGLTEDATDFSVGLSLLYTLEGRYPLFGSK